MRRHTLPRGRFCLFLKLAAQQVEGGIGALTAVFATLDGEEGYCPAKKVDVKDTTGAGDAFFAGTVIGQTYGKTMMESCEIGTRLAASVITTGENVCPRYLPSEFGLDASAPDDAQLALEL